MSITKIPDLKTYKFGFKDPEQFVFKSPKGLSRKVVEEISSQKEEPVWMRSFRLNALKIFEAKPMPSWGVDLSGVNFQEIYYYLKPTEKLFDNWEDVPASIRTTYDRLGIPQAEKELLAGVKAQYDSEVIYGSLLEELEKQGVIFLSMDEGLRKCEDLVKKYFGKLVPPGDNKFAALNSSVWSGGSFVYVPPNIKVTLPLQAYFRINAAKMGQFERTLIIADEGSDVSYVEGCTAPIYTTDSLHAAVVEIFVKRGARVRYTTIQNWSNNVYNLVTKRARVEEEGVMSWVDGNLGSKATMKYPGCFLFGRKAYGEVLSIAYANSGQHQDAGAKAVHLADETSSQIISKSIATGKGRTSYRGLVQVPSTVKHVKSKVVCDALMLTPQSRSDTYPLMKIFSPEVRIEHEATVGRIGREQLFYLKSKGLSEQEASALIVAGFLEPIVKELPMEYAVEMNRLIELKMDGAVG